MKEDLLDLAFKINRKREKLLIQLIVAMNALRYIRKNGDKISKKEAREAIKQVEGYDETIS